MQVQGLVKRNSYRFRYRVVNEVGPSEWSPESFLVPAVRPETPPKPILASSSDTEIQLTLARSPDDGGSFIEDYELEIDESLNEANFVKLVAYDYATDGFSFTALAADIDNPLVPGTYYRFRYRAKNE